MESNFGSIKERIEKQRSEIIGELEQTETAILSTLKKQRSVLKKSLEKGNDSLLKGIEQRESELIERVEKIHKKALTRGKLWISLLLLLLGLIGGAASVIVWEYQHSVTDQQTGAIWYQLK